MTTRSRPRSSRFHSGFFGLLILGNALSMLLNLVLGEWIGAAVNAGSVALLWWLRRL